MVGGVVSNNQGLGILSLSPTFLALEVGGFPLPPLPLYFLVGKLLDSDTVFEGVDGDFNFGLGAKYVIILFII